MTNVVGPTDVLYLAGVPIERILPWAPHPGRQLGMAVSILSYRGAASLTVIGDAHLVPDPERITAEFSREFKKLLKSTTDGAGRTAPKKTLARKAPARKSTARKAVASKKGLPERRTGRRPANVNR
jgi:hypothetical protein